MRLAPRIPYKETVHIKCRAGWIKAMCEDLSLFGVRFRFINGKSCEHKEWVKLKMRIDNRSMVFKGRVYRKEAKTAVVLFNEEDRIITDLLGKFFNQTIRSSGKCPYCKTGISDDTQSCPNCHMPLDFTRIDLIQALRRIKVGDILSGKLPEEMKGKVCNDTTDFIGSCQKMKDVFDLIRRFAPTDYPVLIQGETGTGKELTARAIHERSDRKDGPFLAINCGAIPKELLEVELFGYEKGAFTGAYKSKPGKIEQADGGTLFLDEIGDLPFPLQVKLLRFLEDYTFDRVGGNRGRKANVRIIAATNHDLEELVNEGKFREDLYYRLKVLSIKLPPLRDRGDDINLMAKYFLEKFKREQGRDIEGFTDEAYELIKNYSWPGNVRELINVIKKAVVMTDKKFIDAGDLDINSTLVSKEVSGKKIFDLKEHMDRLERELVEKAFNITGGNVSRMSSMLGVSRPTVYKLIDKYGLT
ncbi:sigma 54-interacting transcriptional regulator [Hydrogenivirga sp.]